LRLLFATCSCFHSSVTSFDLCTFCARAANWDLEPLGKSYIVELRSGTWRGWIKLMW
jgi:hypothetical protein